MADNTRYLDRVTALPPDAPRMPCVVLAHNEGRILADFLGHYRRIGVDRFYIVDDRSTDGSQEFLYVQADVTLFTPVEGSTYSRDKRHWRSELLDTYCSGAWVVVPDVDEHLVYRDVETRDLFGLIREVEAEGAEAVHAVMLDMYRDAPLEAHRFEDGRLIAAFPLFDGPDHYFRIAAPRKFRAKYPVPFAFAIGGLRQRLFEPLGIAPDSASGRLLRNSCDIGGDFSGEGMNRLALSLARFRLGRVLKSVPLYNCSKIPLLKWRRGLFYYNGAHAISQPLKLSRHRAALLHFKFAAGVDGLRYSAERGQHTGGGQFYKNIIDQAAVLAASPVFGGTERYVTSASLGRILS